MHAHFYKCHRRSSRYSYWQIAARTIIVRRNNEYFMRRPTFQLVTALQSKQIGELLRQIVEASLPPARRRISTDATTMSAGELRGYLRARAVSAVRDQTRQFSAAYQLDNSLTQELLERALERTVNLLLRELTEQPPLVIPYIEPRLRAAA
jgi:hypothetical protein